MNGYTCEQAMQFLAERLNGKWPTDLSDAPLCPGWGWHVDSKDRVWFTSTNGVIDVHAWLRSGFINPTTAEQSESNDTCHMRTTTIDPSLIDKIVGKTSYATCVPYNPATAEQPAPNGKGDPILGMVLADLTNRALIGKEKYGEPLKAHNGRNALWDAYQEALDLCMYLRQAIEESK